MKGELIPRYYLRNRQQSAAIEDQYDGIGNIYESELIVIVLDVATDKYQAVLTAKQSSKGENLTLNDLETIMNQNYKELNYKKL
jgi:hypothetical protein